ncbi:hypothetical protein [Hymenobacter lapidiphilus]|nr:hypothetical protein [Hymenobacter sp. CCM 8763]
MSNFTTIRQLLRLSRHPFIQIGLVALSGLFIYEAGYAAGKLVYHISH